MFLVRWFWDTLHQLGLANKSARIVLLGLDNAGKTTLLHMLADNRLVQHTPTHHPTTQTLVMPSEAGGITFMAQDVGGHKAVRKVWSEYYQNVDAIIYLVDAADVERMEESRDELFAMIKVCTQPILVLANKVDAAGALSELQFRERMGLGHTSGNPPIEVYMCSIANREGYGAGFKWLSQHL